MKILENIRANVQLVESDRTKLPESVLSRATYCICNIGEMNANKRVYEKAVWEKVLSDSELQQKLADRCLFGHAEHPAETQSDLRETSHIIHNMWIDEASNKVYQTVDIVDTPTGRIVDCLLRAGSKVGMSTRAEGDLEEVELGEGKMAQRVIPESYQYKTTDFTADPSTYGVEPLDVRMSVAQTLQKELESKHMKAGDRAFAVRLLESLQVDETNVSVNVEDNGQQANVQVSGDMPTTLTTGGGVNVSITPAPAPVMTDPGNTGLGMPAVADEDPMPVDGEPEDATFDQLQDPGDDEEEPAIESVEDEELEEPIEVDEDDQSGYSSDQYDIIYQQKTKKFAVMNLNRGKIVAGWFDTEDEALDALERLESSVEESAEVDEATPEKDALRRDFKQDWDKYGWKTEEEAIQQYAKMNNVSVEELQQLLGKNEGCGECDDSHRGEVKIPQESKDIKRQLNQLKIAEASARAECDKLIEELEESEQSELQVRILQDRIKKIQEAAQAEVDGLRLMLETKVAQAASKITELSEAKAKIDAQYEAYYKSHQEELVEAASNGKLMGRNEILVEYFDNRLTGLRLKTDTNTRTLLEDCETLHEVDSLLEKLVGVARRGALHPEKITEVKIQKTKLVGAEDQASNSIVKGLLSSWK